jgi:DMSO reductase family type II enzyme chaperone
MNMTDATFAGSAGQAVARSHAYALLARGFGYPDEAVFAQFADGTFADALTDAVELCAAGLAAQAESLDVGCSFEDLQSGYLSAFETNMPKPSASLYEGSHARLEDRPGLLLEIKAFYANFGLRMADSTNDLEDTLTAELEFMQFLTAKQSQAESEGLDPATYLRAQRDFLERHLSVWLPAMQAEVAAKVKQPFYVALTNLVAAFVADDLERVRGEIGRLRI